MRNVSGYFAVAAVSALVTLGFSRGFAETPSLDPTVVAPEEFQAAFENEFVRVVRVTVVDGSEVSWQEAVIHGGYPNRVKDTCELFEIELK